MKRVFQKAVEPHQRPRTCPPQPLLETLSQLSQGAHHDKGINNEKKFLERPGGVSPPLKRTVRVPITATMEFRGSGGEKRRHPPPPPLPTSPRPSVATDAGMTGTGFQKEGDDRTRAASPARPLRNEGFTYPGSDLGRRKSSLRTKTRRYGDDLPVFNNGIGGGPIQRYPNLEDRYQPLFPVQPPSPTAASFSRPYHAAGAQQQPRSGRS